MCDPLSVATGVLSVVGFVLKAASGAKGMMDKTVTAHDTQRRVVRNVQRELDKTIKGSTNMQIVLNAMLGDSEDKIVKRMCRKCALFMVAPLTPDELISTGQSRLYHRTTAADDSAGDYPRIY